MIGENGSSDEVKLSTTKDQMERDSLDHFDLSSEDVGPLKKVIIRHDNTGVAPGWYLHWATVKDQYGRIYDFQCNDWLAKGEKTRIIKLLKATPEEVVAEASE